MKFDPVILIPTQPKRAASSGSPDCSSKWSTQIASTLIWAPSEHLPFNQIKTNQLKFKASRIDSQTAN